ncbi:hypothetical protein C477_08443 [Haloterrigena salina JCM 13891]|uniref:Uncharacterized protein n=1 Tax=Haloterrigena salina JCM 13891 TaxID=1227488 RepID=M0C9P5_9EURY|nr:hypothetical protein [Haloterrigena salina]ELZ19353.1 hypothetical protein C477_08443 [Haloterrigena salina JCM 13891]
MSGPRHIAALLVTVVLGTGLPHLEDITAAFDLWPILGASTVRRIGERSTDDDLSPVEIGLAVFGENGRSATGTDRV